MPKILEVSDVAACDGCPLRRKFPSNTFVAPNLQVGSTRLAVGEAPGEDESIQGQPFVGGAGRVLRGSATPDGRARTGGLYPSIGIRDSDLSFVNCIQCRPPDNIFPTDALAKSYISPEEGQKAVDHCKKAHLEPVLKGRAWKRIDLFGGTALEIVAEKQGIDLWRGTPLPIPMLGDKLITVPTFHPAYLMRDQKFFPVAGNDLEKKLEYPPEDYNLKPTLSELSEFIGTAEFAFDIETTYDKVDPKILLVGFSSEPGKAIVAPFRGEYVAIIREIFRQAKVTASHNGIMFDLPILKRYGIVPGPDAENFDSMLLQHLRFPNLPHDLEFVTSQFSCKPPWKHLKGLDFELYCARDVDSTMAVFRGLLEITEPSQRDYYKQVQSPLARVCHLMRVTGVKFDPSRLDKVREELTGEVRKLEAQLPPELKPFEITVNKRKEAPKGTLSEKTGKPVKFLMVPTQESVCPWRSAEEKKKYLYETLKLPVQHHVKTKEVTVDKIALDKLYRRTKHPVLPLLKRLGQISTLLSGFVKERPKGSAKRIHPSFNPHGTNTGRLSSSDPNFQNQPENVRYLYVPSHKDWKLVSLDYSQIENRIVAWMAQDTERLRRFDDPAFSEHKFCASLLFGLDYEDIAKDKDRESPYMQGKIIVHGADRLLGARKIADNNDLDFKQTKDRLAKWKSTIVKTISWQSRTVALAETQGFLDNPFGRRGYFYTSQYATQAISFMPQSTAADVIFRAMIGLTYDRIGLSKAEAERISPISIALPKQANLLLSVHDELVVECPGVMVDEVIEKMDRVMTQPHRCLEGLKLYTGKAVGDDWGSVQAYA